MDGRRYSDGLHQAIEAKENVKVEAATQTYADFDVQIRAVLGREKLRPTDHKRATEHVVQLILRGCGLQVPVA